VSKGLEKAYLAWKDYILATAVVALSALISIQLRSRLQLTDLAMVYLFGVILIAMRCSRIASIFGSCLSVAAFHFFCVPYVDSFVLVDSLYLITLVAMLAVALVISDLTTRIRSQARIARDAEIRVETERLRNSLLSAVSHDLKTPLSSIYGAATSLLEQGERLQEGDRRDLAAGIAAEVERLNRIVSNLLEMTRLETTPEVQKDWQSIEEIVGVALARMEVALAGRRIDIHIPAQLPLILVDDLLIELVLVNLLENVAKYTPAEGPIEIAVEEDGNSVTISVCDKGPGFPAGDEERVFEKFFKGAGGARGVGLGLAICRAIVSAHQGVIYAENRQEGGAAVHVRLPKGGTPPGIDSAVQIA
jgi:K+-sensing histidine kinase KdpD